MKTITVSYIGKKLELSDRGHTDAKPGEQINWHPGKGVRAVTDVTVKTESPISTEKFWSDAPHNNGKIFMGTIKSDVENDGAWDYDITCDVGTNEHTVFETEDPRIQVHST